MIETLEDIVEQLMNLLGVYGAHDDGEARPCRACRASDLRERILAAVEVERKLRGQD
jgi:hypothetical protein